MKMNYFQETQCIQTFCLDKTLVNVLNFVLLDIKACQSLSKLNIYLSLVKFSENIVK